MAVAPSAWLRRCLLRVVSRAAPRKAVKLVARLHRAVEAVAARAATASRAASCLAVVRATRGCSTCCRADARDAKRTAAEGGQHAAQLEAAARKRRRRSVRGAIEVGFPMEQQLERNAPRGRAQEGAGRLAAENYEVAVPRLRV